MASTSILVTARAANRATASVTATCIGADPLTPTGVLTRNLGNGAIEVAWEAGGGVARHFDCYIATSPDGTFSKANTSPLLSTRCVIPNIPFGQTVYVKVKAVDGAGRESSYSALGRDAVAVRATTQLAFKGLSGTLVPAGIVLAMPLEGELIAFRTTASGVIP